MIYQETSEYAFIHGLEEDEEKIRRFFYDDEHMEFTGLSGRGAPNMVCLEFRTKQRSTRGEVGGVLVPINHEAFAAIADDDSMLGFIRASSHEAIIQLLVDDLETGPS